MVVRRRVIVRVRMIVRARVRVRRLRSAGRWRAAQRGFTIDHFDPGGRDARPHDARDAQFVIDYEAAESLL
jgi:hypothetical protein